ncbi:MAG: hypothetical protein OQK12_17150 [Motiliproteus sp.]|nr:hypothetical protein [Motiliproteus sp.]MCW9052983.1 hypothetical protein [Motiliproteus sp.]
MTREKKKVRSVAGQKFVPIKQEKRDSAAKAEYKERKQKNLAKKKRTKSLTEKQREAELNAKQNQGEQPKKRKSRLKNDPKAVAERSKELLQDSSSEES